MANKDYIKVLIDRKKELEQELELVNRLIGRTNIDHPERLTDANNNEADSFPLIVSDKGKSTIARIKSAIRKLLQHEVSLQIDDIRANLENMDVEFTRSAIHNAIRSMRENGELVSYKINRSNHHVYYVNPEGVDMSIDKFPVKPEYRPQGIRSEDVEEIDFKGGD